jgi:diguanylate cyclase (GGDEF)-like protein
MISPFRCVFERAPFAVVILQHNGLVAKMNSAAGQLFPVAEPIGRAVYELFLQEREGEEFFQSLVAAGRLVDYPAILKGEGSKGFTTLLHAERRDDGDGFVLFIRDEERKEERNEERKEERDEEGRRSREAELQQRIEQLEEDMRQESREMTALVEKLARRNRDFERLNDMSMALQLCRSREEIYGVIAKHAANFFPGMSGEMLLKSEDGGVLKPVLRFGALHFGLEDVAAELCPMAGDHREIYSADVQALFACKESACPHAEKGRCLPVSAFGERMGVFILHPHEEAGDMAEKLCTAAHTAAALVDHIALDLANFKLRETLLAKSTKDPLTGVFNRRSMAEALEVEARRCKRKQRRLGLIMFDIDHFKAFNDNFGHKAGDLVLSTIGEHLSSNFRPEDIPCRYGGEEFLVILPEIDRTALLNRAEELRQSIKDLEFQHNGKDLGTVTVSIGGAIFPDDADEVQDLICIADRRLYQVKHSGRDGVCIDEFIPADSDAHKLSL